MDFLQIIKIIFAVGTIATGLLALIRPRSAVGFTGLEPVGGRGITELRAVFGGAFIALGLAPLILNSPATYTMLGFMYLVIAAVRAPSMLLDRSAVKSNIISLITEIVFGIALVL